MNLFDKIFREWLIPILIVLVIVAALLVLGALTLQTGLQAGG